MGICDNPNANPEKTSIMVPPLKWSRNVLYYLFNSNQGQLILFTGLEADVAFLADSGQTINIHQPLALDRKIPCICINMSKIYF